MPQIPAPVAPTTLAATTASSSGIDLTWTDASNNEDGFKVERGTDGTTFTQIGTTIANTAQYLDTGLTASTTYYYRVRAYNSTGDSAYSNTANATTQVVKLPKTGQITSYGTGTIDDGGLQRGVAWPNPRFSVGTGAEVDCVTDNLTGLMWVKTPDSTLRDWQTALNYADGLTLCGYSDWRLPNRKELRSLANYGQTNVATWLNNPAQGFSNAQANLYWSSTTYAGDTGYAWNVDMYDGNVNYYFKTVNYYVWPVRSGQ